MIELLISKAKSFTRDIARASSDKKEILSFQCFFLRHSNRPRRHKSQFTDVQPPKLIHFIILEGYDQCLGIVFSIESCKSCFSTSFIFFVRVVIFLLNNLLQR